jgi:hypothetical protein
MRKLRKLSGILRYLALSMGRVVYDCARLAAACHHCSDDIN